MAVAIRFVMLLAISAIMATATPLRARAQAAACPADQGCSVASGHYRIVLPPEAASEQRVGAIMFFHGYQGSAQEVVESADLVAVARGLGVALIAPDGIGKSWSFPGSPSHERDEFAFVDHVLADVTRRFPVDPARIMASGFSLGGSMVWYLACRMPGRFAGFAPIAGAFWEPLPASCAGPRPNLVHVHGTGDSTVPLAGRTVRESFRQADVFRSLSVLAPGGCTAPWATQARGADLSAALTCRVASDCGGPARLELCLHSGGHVADPAWVERAWRMTMGGDAPATGARLTSP